MRTRPAASQSVARPAAASVAVRRSRLREQAAEFDPDTRDRFLAGALIPAAWVVQAQRFRRWFQNEVMRVFADVDVILALATPITAPKLGQKTFDLDGAKLWIGPGNQIYCDQEHDLDAVTTLRKAAGKTTAIKF